MTSSPGAQTHSRAFTKPWTASAVFDAAGNAFFRAPRMSVDRKDAAVERHLLQVPHDDGEAGGRLARLDAHRPPQPAHPDAACLGGLVDVAVEGKERPGRLDEPGGGGGGHRAAPPGR